MVNGAAGNNDEGNNGEWAFYTPASPVSDGKLTQLLRDAMDEFGVTERALADWDAETPCSPEQVAAALPAWKRVLDFAIIVVTLPVWWPVMLLIATWIAITSPGPIFYRQPRIGLRGRRFMIVKFRTMKVNAETHCHETYLEQLMVSDRPMIKLDAKGDPRLIPGGKFLRALGLDELPQLFNVLRGEMSIVGPRPCTLREFELYKYEDRSRLNAVPGLTGFWQVNGKNRTTFRQMVEMDTFYSQNLSLGLDLKIICRTFPALFIQLSELWQAVPVAPSEGVPPVANVNR